MSELAMNRSYVAEASSAAQQSTSAVQDASQPTINLRLDRKAYKRGDTVQLYALGISNPSEQNRAAEPKAWIAFPQMQPISLGIPYADEMLNLAPGFNTNYGTTPIMKISSTSPSGIVMVGARLLDPVTGNLLSQDLNSFSISAPKGEKSDFQQLSGPTPQVTLERTNSESGIGYTIINGSNMPEDLEVKVWREGPDGSTTSISSFGADGSFTLPSGAIISLYPQSSSSVLRVRVLEASTGNILCEN
jgi:hypothetical protein